MYVHFKQSGELLTAEKDKLWTPGAVQATADKIRLAHTKASDLDMEGLLVVSGAGNLIRGRELKDQRLALGAEDLLGRLATIQNTLVLKAALEKARVPVAVFITKNMNLCDATIGTMEPYDVEAVHEAYSKERVVLIAGGTGEDNSTTDNAVLEYARRHKATYTDDDVLVLKGTKVEGVFTSDPMKDPDARQFSTISAKTMLENYDRYDVVDEACLRAIIDTGLSMRVYRDASHDLTSVIESGRHRENTIGTLIVHKDIQPVMA